MQTVHHREEFCTSFLWFPEQQVQQEMFRMIQCEETLSNQQSSRVLAPELTYTSSTH